jgi:hypothetical protein
LAEQGQVKGGIPCWPVWGESDCRWPDNLAPKSKNCKGSSKLQAVDLLMMWVISDASVHPEKSNKQS